jgi:hypothetical protein
MKPEDSMNIFSRYALKCLLLLCAVSGVARSQEQPTKLVVTEGHYIGYVSVADALATLNAKGLAAAPAANGGVSYVESDSRTAWTFAAKDDPAYPSVVRYVYTRNEGVLQAEVTILCEASADRCEKFRSDIRNNLAQLSKMMSGDRTANCRVNDGAMKCSAEPDRQ